MHKPKILLAEDDPNLLFVIEDHLTQEGFEVIAAKNGQEALFHYEKYPVDLCILDVMMPKMDGFTLAIAIRKLDEFVPILFLTARSMERDRLKGFEIGGDDYIAKPFSIAELTHRVHVFLRRAKFSDAPREQLTKLGKLSFDERNLQIISNGQKTQMTQMEADLLKIFSQQKNKLVKREEILVKIWGENDYFKGRSLDVFISRLRKYLKDDPNLEIRNHHGVGFSLIEERLS